MNHRILSCDFSHSLIFLSMWFIIIFLSCIVIYCTVIPLYFFFVLVANSMLFSTDVKLPININCGGEIWRLKYIKQVKHETMMQNRSNIDSIQYDACRRQLSIKFSIMWGGKKCCNKVIWMWKVLLYWKILKVNDCFEEGTYINETHCPEFWRHI